MVWDFPADLETRIDGRLHRVSLADYIPAILASCGPAGP